MERAATGVEGLDEMLEGGLPRGRTTLLSGTCGTGKTTLAAQFLHHGALNGENGILVTLEQSAQELRNDMLTLGLDLQKLEDENKLTIIDTSLSKAGMRHILAEDTPTKKGSFTLNPGEFNLENLTAIIQETAQKTNAKRITIDSLPALDYLIKEKDDIRRTLITLNYALKKDNLTTLILTEGDHEDTISKHGIEEYITDGVIILKVNEALDTRTIKIRKMRTTNHTLKPQTIQITQNGIKIQKTKGL
jgi:circadian clock protein KaiC